MPNFESGVATYIYVRATVKMRFPVDFKGAADISCMRCDFFNRHERKCNLNGKICEYPEKYVGSMCPLEMEEHDES